MTNKEFEYARLHEALRQLFADAGYTIPELEQALRGVERQEAGDERLAALEAENNRLKQEAKRLRELYYGKTVNSMSTKLKDALRE
ncbi:hypothetical protein [Paenibacillus piri]|uniref:Uncharacterized protein n=1 Tax=Paenibacillus piri TaxID=2547395 RepID=A0A4R5KNW1_9BACL|nr:hypothetical protein [Paenibacillus piri]TDF96608.1 hypothetical protein E1757_16055 [Paenibacillus piri]